jgi:membrane-bound lytic murein transglycosylase F
VGCARAAIGRLAHFAGLGRHDRYAIVGSIAASLARNIYLDFDVAFAAGGKREIAWAVPPRFAELKSDLDAFIARLRRDGTLARLADRYMPDPRQIQRIDAGALQEKIRTVLPQYKSLFHDAQEKSGIEWRLLAAIAYQESQWDPAPPARRAFEASCRSPRTPPGILGSAT